MQVGRYVCSRYGYMCLCMYVGRGAYHEGVAGGYLYIFIIYIYILYYYIIYYILYILYIYYIYIYYIYI